MGRRGPHGAAGRRAAPARSAADRVKRKTNDLGGTSLARLDYLRVDTTDLPIRSDLRLRTGRVHVAVGTFLGGRSRLLRGRPGVRCNVPMVAAGVSHRSGTFPVLHVPHVVEANSSGLDRTGVGLVRVTDIEVDTCRKGLPLTRRATRLNDARFDTKSSVHRFPIGTRCTLVLQFLRAEGGLGKGHEPVRIIHGEVERYRIEAGRDMSRRLVSEHGLHHRVGHPRSALQSFGPGARGRAFRRTHRHGIRFSRFAVPRVGLLWPRDVPSEVELATLAKYPFLREASAAEGRLESESDDFVIHMASQLAMDLRREDGGFRLHFTDFLRFTNTMRDAPWKLINQRVDRGYVTLQRAKALRVMRNAIQRHIEEGLPLPVNDDIVSAFRADLREIRGILEAKKATFKAEDIGKVSITRFPPCMYNLLAQIQNHENVPHMGRFED